MGDGSPEVFVTLDTDCKLPLPCNIISNQEHALAYTKEESFDTASRLYHDCNINVQMTTSTEYKNYLLSCNEMK